jgi:tRNA 2-thiouridine synthesizing protein A
MMMDIYMEIDTSGLRCPQPILKAKRALASMESGQLLKVIATDANAPNDFLAFSRQTGNTLIHNEFVDEEFILILRRK